MRVLLALFLLTLATDRASAECECLWRGAFTDIQAETDLVVSGAVIASRGNAIDLRPSRVLRGTHHGDAIRIWMKTADYCRPEVALFPVGTQWVMALDRINETIPGGFNPGTPNISYGRVGDYSLSSCGGYWLNQTGDRVSGNLVQAPRWVREPEMTPILLDLLDAHMQGRVSREALLEATREDPGLRELMLDTRTFIKNEN